MRHRTGIPVAMSGFTQRKKKRLTRDLSKRVVPNKPTFDSVSKTKVVH